MLSPRKRPAVFVDSELPCLSGSGKELRLPLKQLERTRVSVISFDQTCWRKLEIQTAEVVDGRAAVPLGKGESRGSKHEQYESLVWAWFSHFESRPMPAGSQHIVTFALSGPFNDQEHSGEELWCIKMVTEMLSRFENMRVVPWNSNSDVFWDVLYDDYNSLYCRDSRPELPWEVDDCSDESI